MSRTMSSWHDEGCVSVMRTFNAKGYCSDVDSAKKSSDRVVPLEAQSCCRSFRVLVNFPTRLVARTTFTSGP